MINITWKFKIRFKKYYESFFSGTNEPTGMSQLQLGPYQQSFRYSVSAENFFWSQLQSILKTFQVVPNQRASSRPKTSQDLAPGPRGTQRSGF